MAKKACKNCEYGSFEHLLFCVECAALHSNWPAIDTLAVWYFGNHIVSSEGEKLKHPELRAATQVCIIAEDGIIARKQKQNKKAPTNILAPPHLRILPKVAIEAVIEPI